MNPRTTSGRVRQGCPTKRCMGVHSRNQRAPRRVRSAFERMQGSEAAPHSSQFLNFRGGVLGALQGVRCQVEQLFENSASFHVPPLPHPADKRLEGQGAHRVTKASSVLSSHTGQGFPAANTSLPRNVSKVSQIKLVHRTAIPATSTVKVPATSSPTCVVHRKPSTVASAPLSSRLRSDDGDRARTSSATVRTRRGTSVVSSVRVSGEEALIKYAEKLTEWEKTEILDFRTVYFLGSQAAKKSVQGEGVKNNGFDDASGFYICKPHDHLLYRYELHDLLGKGTFGQVMKAMDHRTHSLVAIKIVKNERPFLRQAREEIRILEALRRQDKNDSHNIVHILDSFTFRGHVCITFELLGMSLHQVLKKTRGKGMSLCRVQKIARAVLRCLDVLHRNNIVHCDLKPENILLRRPLPTSAGCTAGLQNDISIKVIDFGSSCYEQKQIYTYIQSRYYRAPEVILGLRYGCAIDMWSLACVLGEVLTAKPIFAGEDEFDQLSSIMEVRGVPSRSLLDRCKRAEKFFTAQGQPRYCTSGSSREKPRGPPMSLHLSLLLKNTEDGVFLDFMRRTLSWDPAARLSASDALQHPWVMRNGALQSKAVTVGDVLSPSRAKLLEKPGQMEASSKSSVRLPVAENTSKVSVTDTQTSPLKTQSDTCHV